MRNWIFTENGIVLANIRELEADNYYLRIIVESKSLKQLPVIGLLMHFVPEVDMTIVKESSDFYIGDENIQECKSRTDHNVRDFPNEKIKCRSKRLYGQDLLYKGIAHK